MIESWGLLWLLPVTAATSGLLTGGIYRYAIVYRVLDIPNERSSHTRPMPRGGGVAVVVAFLGVVGGLSLVGATEVTFAIALVGSGVTVAFVGFLDDHRPIAVHWRLLVHIVAAAWVLWWLGGLPVFTIAGVQLHLGWIGHALAAIGLVWLLNLYNFMDGIDGIAGFEAVTVGCGVTIIYWQRGLGHELWLAPALLAMAALGFLLWNWPPARIFMGDAGSGFLGLMLGAMAIRAAWVDAELLWIWMILLGVFVVDTTVTLFRRLLRDEKPHEGHNQHAYQHAASQSISHQTITLAVGAINVFWLLPLAIVVNLHWLGGLIGVLIAYAPLIWLAIRFHAGLLPNSPRMN